jgi:diaminopimelate epimerase
MDYIIGNVYGFNHLIVNSNDYNKQKIEIFLNKHKNLDIEFIDIFNKDFNNIKTLNNKFERIVIPESYPLIIKYLYDNHLIKKDKKYLDTDQGEISFDFIKEIPFEISLNFKKAKLENTMLRINDLIDSFGRIINIGSNEIKIYSLFISRIITVVFVDDINLSYNNAALLIMNNKIFKQGTDVCFVKVVDKTHLDVKTYSKEYGQIISLSSMAGALYVAHSLNLCAYKVEINNLNNLFEATFSRKHELYINSSIKDEFIKIKED